MKILTTIGSLLATATLLTSLSAQAQNGESVENRESLAVTVYNSNLGVIKDVRKIDLQSGKQTIKLRGVPTLIDATTVKVTSKNHPKDVEVIEQNYEYDLISQQKLLEKYIDKQITVTDENGVAIIGTLLAVEANKLTLSTSTGILMLPNLEKYKISVPELGDGLITKPTLVWNLESGGNYRAEPLEVLYQTAGMSWHAEYIATLSADDKMLDLSGWVSLENNSGATYPDAKLKLIAGDIHRAQQPPVMYDGAYTMRAEKVQNAVQEHAFFEYHAYDLPHPTTIKNNEVKQVSLLEATGVTAKKVYSYSGGSNASVTIEFRNSEGNKLGMPLPKGIVRLMKRDRDGSVEFVGEDRIEHTPKDEDLRLTVGDAFDITGVRTVKDQRNLGQQSSRMTVETKLKNHKDEAVTIDVVENFGTNWEILNSNFEYEKKNAYTAIFKVPVKANSESTLTYTVITSW